jgi:hypothetical protein
VFGRLAGYEDADRLALDPVKPKMLVGNVLANRMARQIWSMLTENEYYRNPELAMA